VLKTQLRSRLYLGYRVLRTRFGGAILSIDVSLPAMRRLRRFRNLHHGTGPVNVRTFDQITQSFKIAPIGP